MITVRKDHADLAEALASIKAIEPALWARLTAGFAKFIDPELKTIIRVPPDLILVAQGRAQVAEDLQKLIRDCSEIAAHLKSKPKI